MKNKVIMICILVLSAMLTACGGKTESKEKTESQAISSDEKDDNGSNYQANLNDVVEADGVTLTFTGFGMAKSLNSIIDENYMLPTEYGMKDGAYTGTEEQGYASFEFSVKNTGSYDLELERGSYIELIYKDKYTYKAELNAYITSDSDSLAYYDKQEKKWTTISGMTLLQPLESNEYRAGLTIPSEVFSNPDEIVKVNYHIFVFGDNNKKHEIVVSYECKNGYKK